MALPKSHPFVNAESLTLDQLEDFPYIYFEQEEGEPAYFAEEALADEARHKSIACTDRASLSELIVALNGYMRRNTSLASSGIFHSSRCESAPVR